MRLLHESHAAWQALRTATDAWLFTVVLVFVLPVLGYLRFRKFLAGGTRVLQPAEKYSLYARIVSTQWLLVLAMYLILRRHGLTLADAGQRIAYADITIPVTVILLLLLAVVAFNLLRRIRKMSAEQLTGAFGPIQGMMPASASEMAAFAVVCLTAGICEELLFRGWLINMLWTGTDSLLIALLAGSAFFGIGHAYQGKKGILRTGFVGLQLGVCYLTVTSLIPGQALHAAFDLMAAVAGAIAMARTRQSNS